jgi:DNA-binding response OmpR family regulator
MAKILIIEDDTSLRTQVKEVLENYEFEVVAVIDFQRVEEIFEEEKPDLVILDINLPYYNGNYYCKKIRKSSRVPIIITSARNSDMDQIMSMELGADDYIIKPFNIPVLLAKINAMLRRTMGDYSMTEQNKTFSLKGLKLEDDNFKLSYKGKILDLSKNEYRLMKSLMQKPDVIISREELLDLLWDNNQFIDDNTLTVNVTRLKGKLSTLGLPQLIQTKRGAGYLLDISKMGAST